MESPSAFTQSYHSPQNSNYHSPTNVYQSPTHFATQPSRESPQRGDSTMSLNTTQSPTQPYQSPPQTYQIGTQSTRASPTCESTAALPTTDEEWAKVADAVERRRVQNRNAQRKYRKKCKRRAEELERRKAQGVFTSTTSSVSPTPISRSRMSTPQAPTQMGSRRTSSVPGLRHHDSMMSARSSSLPRVREYTPMVGQDDGSYSQFRHRNSDSSIYSESALPLADPIYPWLSTDALIGQTTTLESIPFGNALDLNQSICQEPSTFPDMFPISSVPTTMFANDFYTSSEGTISPQSHERSNSNSSISERSASLGPDGPSGRTMLHIAASKGNQSMLRLLLDKGVDPNVKDTYGFTPLHLAVENNHSEVADLLIEHGANIYATTEPWANPDQSFIQDQPWVNPDQTWVKQEAA